MVHIIAYLRVLNILLVFFLSQSSSAKWEQFRYYCYYFGDKLMTAPEIMSHCNSIGAEMLTIYSPDETAFLTRHIKNAVWIQLKRVKTGHYEFQWNNGIKPTYTNWARGKPDKLNDANASCVHLYTNGEWNDDNCFLVAGIVCKRRCSNDKLVSELTSLTNQVDNVKVGCPKGWKQWNGNCYYFNDTLIPASELILKCKSFSAQLLTVSSSEEAEFLVENIRVFQFGTLTDLKRVKVGVNQFRFSNGDSPKYTNWAKDYPKLLTNESAPCVYISPSGIWTDDLCSYRTHQICQIKNFNIMLSTDVINLNSRVKYLIDSVNTLEEAIICPQNWKHFNGDCYYFNDTLLTSKEIDAKCKSFGGEMIMPSSAEETEFLVKHFSHFEWSTIIPLTRVRKGVNRFQWRNGSIATYTNWYPGRPNNLTNENASCVFVFTSGYWNDDLCSFKSPQACIMKGYARKLVSNLVKSSKDLATLTSKVNSDSRTLMAKQKELKLRVDQVVKEQTRLEIDYRRLAVTLVQIKEAIEQQVNDALRKIQESADEVTRFLKNEKINSMEESDLIPAEEFTEHNPCSTTFEKCYSFVKAKKTFNEAETYCRSIGERLLSIANKEENEFIKSNSFFGSTYWIGSIRTFLNSNYFANIYDGNFGYQNWAVNEPKQSSTNNCLNVKHGEWFANSCTDRFSFVCESPANRNQSINAVKSTTLLERLTSRLSVISNLSEIIEMKSLQQENRYEEIKRFIKDVSKIKEIDLNEALNKVGDHVDFDVVGKRNRSKRQLVYERSTSEVELSSKIEIILIRLESIELKNNRLHNENCLLKIAVVILILVVLILMLYIVARNFT